jgi:hypothetical protein
MYVSLVLSLHWKVLFYLTEHTFPLVFLSHKLLPVMLVGDFISPETIKRTSDFLVKCPIFLSDFKQIKNFLPFFLNKMPQLKFYESFSTGS